MKYFGFFLSTGLLSCFVFGCAGGGGDTSSSSEDDTQLVRQLVWDIPDSAIRGDEKLSQLFTDGHAPKKNASKTYAKYVFRPAEVVRIEGDTATFSVTITDNQQVELGTKDWVAVKDAGQWKLQEAPLP